MLSNSKKKFLLTFSLGTTILCADQNPTAALGLFAPLMDAVASRIKGDGDPHNGGGSSDPKKGFDFGSASGGLSLPGGLNVPGLTGGQSTTQTPQGVSAGGVVQSTIPGQSVTPGQNITYNITNTITDSHNNTVTSTPDSSVDIAEKPPVGYVPVVGTDGKSIPPQKTVDAQGQPVTLVQVTNAQGEAVTLQQSKTSTGEDVIHEVKKDANGQVVTNEVPQTAIQHVDMEPLNLEEKLPNGFKAIPGKVAQKIKNASGTMSTMIEAVNEKGEHVTLEKTFDESGVPVLLSHKIAQNGQKISQKLDSGLLMVRVNNHKNIDYASTDIDDVLNNPEKGNNHRLYTKLLRSAMDDEKYQSMLKAINDPIAERAILKDFFFGQKNEKQTEALHQQMENNSKKQEELKKKTELAAAEQKEQETMTQEISRLTQENRTLYKQIKDLNPPEGFMDGYDSMINNEGINQAANGAMPAASNVMPAEPVLPVVAPTAPTVMPAAPVLPVSAPTVPAVMPTAPVLPVATPTAPAVMPTAPVLPVATPTAPAVMPAAPVLPVATPTAPTVMPASPTLPKAPTMPMLPPGIAVQSSTATGAKAIGQMPTLPAAPVTPQFGKAPVQMPTAPAPAVLTQQQVQPTITKPNTPTMPTMPTLPGITVQSPIITGAKPTTQSGQMPVAPTMPQLPKFG